MIQVNGLFFLVLKEDGTYLKLIGQKEGGQPITYDEVNGYLVSKRILNYDKTKVANALRHIEDEVEIKVLDQKVVPESETMLVHVTEDKLQAIVRFYPPSTHGKRIAKADIIAQLVTHGVKFGVDEEMIDDFLAHRIYCTDFVMAKALFPVEGRSASIKYHFNSNVTRKPKMNDDGTVDFHQLDLITHVKAGDLLATLSPLDAGKPGLDVCGRVIRQKPVKNMYLKQGSMTKLSEDGLQLYSLVDGHVSLIQGKVNVSNVYEISSDIDTSTGDVDYEGSVAIKGNVITGFTVKAKGNISVEGVVEGATLISDGDIILKRGMQGMNRGILKAKGNVVAKFIENATIECDGCVTADAILHSKVYARKEIVVSGRKGYATGGELHSGTSIHIKSAGSAMGTITLLEVGIDPKITLEFRRLESEISDYHKELYKVQQILELFKKKYGLNNIPPHKLSTYILAKETCVKYTKDLEVATARYEVLSNVMEENDNGTITVDGVIYPGCKVVISNVPYYIRNELYAKAFIKDGVDIKVLEHS